MYVEIFKIPRARHGTEDYAAEKSTSFSSVIMMMVKTGKRDIKFSAISYMHQHPKTHLYPFTKRYHKIHSREHMA